MPLEPTPTTSLSRARERAGVRARALRTAPTDADRSAALRALGFHVLRYTNREALAERDAVLADILNWLNSNHPHPNPLPQAGERANTKESSHG